MLFPKTLRYYLQLLKIYYGRYPIAFRYTQWIVIQNPRGKKHMPPLNLRTSNGIKGNYLRETLEYHKIEIGRAGPLLFKNINALP